MEVPPPGNYLWVVQCKSRQNCRWIISLYKRQTAQECAEDILNFQNAMLTESYAHYKSLRFALSSPLHTIPVRRFELLSSVTKLSRVTSMSSSLATLGSLWGATKFLVRDMQKFLGANRNIFSSPKLGGHLAFHFYVYTLGDTPNTI